MLKLFTIQLNFDDISNTVDMSKRFVSFNDFLTFIPSNTWISRTFLNSPLYIEITKFDCSSLCARIFIYVKRAQWCMAIFNLYQSSLEKELDLYKDIYIEELHIPKFYRHIVSISFTKEKFMA